MAKQLHKRFSTEEVKMFLKQYLDNKKKLPYILEILQITKRRFFYLLQEYRENPDGFSIDYKRKKPTRKIPTEVEKNIVNELRIEKQLIEDKELLITSYNYSYIKDQLYKKYKQKVSVPTIIKRAKKVGFYKPKKRKKKLHDRQVQTEYIGSFPSMIPLITSSHPMLIRNGASSQAWMTLVGFFSTISWWKRKQPGSISLPYRISFLPMVSLFATMWRRHYLQTDDVDT